MPRIPRRKFTALPEEIQTEQIEKQNNIILGIAVGVMIMACGIIYVVASFF